MLVAIGFVEQQNPECTASLTGTVAGRPISAMVTADINDNGSCITFTVENTSPLNGNGSSTLIDQFFFEFIGDFISNILLTASNLVWDFVSNNGNPVTPRPCGDFRYKFERTTQDTRLAIGETGTFTICSDIGTFSAASLVSPVCVHVQNVLG